jgi:tRNA threonylcarbamoyladenosine biosynthesis protein TsaB
MAGRPGPVLILSLDTTTRGGSAAVLDDDRVLALVAGDATRTHGERLPGELELALHQAGQPLSAIALLAVASGPGAFTGLRIGIAAMQGVSLVSGLPVVGVSALDALALSAFEQLGAARARIGCWVDAARGEVFTALYDVEGAADDGFRLTALTEAEVGLPDTIRAAWQPFECANLVLIGDAASRYVEGPRVPPRVLPHPLLAPAVGRLARRIVALGGSHLPHQLQPLYVRRPDVEQSSRRPPQPAV